MIGTELALAAKQGVELQNVHREFPRTGKVIDDLTLTIAPGEFVSFLGPSGCGKSTALRLIAGLDQPDGGSVSANHGGNKYFRGFVFQEPQLLPWRSVLRNVALPLEITGDLHAEDRARVILDKVGLGDALEKFPHELSGGMKMRTSLARALVAQPSLLLLDEPFAALDEITRQRLQEDLWELWKNLRMTVVFVTHSVNEAAFLAERVILFSSRPARIRREQRIDLGPERTAQTRLGETYQRAVAELQSALRSES